MILSTEKDLTLLTERLIPEQYLGTSFEKIVRNFLGNLKDQHNYIDNLTNRIDLNKIETRYTEDELLSYVGQYAKNLEDILKIPYPNILKNGDFSMGSYYWKLVAKFNTPNETTQQEYTGLNYFENENISFRYEMNDHYFRFEKPELQEKNWNYLVQEHVFTGSKKKYEISFEIIEIQEYSQIKIYLDTEESKLESTLPVFQTGAVGAHKFRVDFDTLQKDTINLNFFILFNGNIKIKNVSLTEYDRITQEDIMILSRQLIQNKGKINLYTFLFNLLHNLGSSSNIDVSISIDEFENTSGISKPRVYVSELFEDTISNIKYDETDPVYRFGWQEYYTKGSTFKEYVTTYNSDKVIPFKYLVQATFDRTIFDKYILPIVHPAGWEIHYEGMKLVDMTDATNIHLSTELDSSIYQNFLFYRLREGSSPVYNPDVLHLPVTTKKYKINTNLGYDVHDILGSTEFYALNQKTNILETLSPFILAYINSTVLGLSLGLDFYNMNLAVENYINSILVKHDINEVLESKVPLTYGSDFIYDEGMDLVFSDSTEENKFLDSLGIGITQKFNFDSSQVASLIQNSSIVKKIINYGHGIDGNFYLYKGANSIVDLSTVTYDGPNWFNLSTRQPI